MTQPNPRDELYAYATVAFKEDGVPPIVDQHVTRMLDAYRAAVLREAADEAERENAHCPPLTASPCQPCAVRTAVAAELRRMAEEARS